MNKIEDIKYKIISDTNEDDDGDNYLQINIKGVNINTIIINTIRRAIYTYVPIYAFTKFIFTVNETIYNNNYIKLRLSNLPVIGIPNRIDKFIPNKKVTDTSINNDNADYDNNEIDMNTNNSFSTSTLNEFTMFVDCKFEDKDKNKCEDDQIMTVTTDNAKFYYAEKNIQSPYKNPITIIKLQPGQTINFSAITTLGTEKESAIFSPVSVCHFQIINENEFNFIVESKGQLDGYRIIEVALINIISTIESLLKSIPTDQTTHVGEIIINNENSTIGNLISHGMQNHKNVKFAGYNVPHLLEDKVMIHYELINSNIKFKDVISDVIGYLIKLFEELKLLNSNAIRKKKNK